MLDGLASLGAIAKATFADAGEAAKANTSATAAADEIMSFCICASKACVPNAVDHRGGAILVSTPSCTWMLFNRVIRQATVSAAIFFTASINRLSSLSHSPHQ